MSAPSTLSFFEPLPKPVRQHPAAGLQRMLLSVPEAAFQLGVGRTRMYELIGTGQVASVRVGRLRKVPTSALVEFVEHCRAIDTSGDAS